MQIFVKTLTGELGALAALWPPLPAGSGIGIAGRLAVAYHLLVSCGASAVSEVDEQMLVTHGVFVYARDVVLAMLAVAACSS
jgi:hypothetical protein